MREDGGYPVMPMKLNSNFGGTSQFSTKAGMRQAVSTSNVGASEKLLAEYEVPKGLNDQNNLIYVSVTGCSSIPSRFMAGRMGKYLNVLGPTLPSRSFFRV